MRSDHKVDIVRLQCGYCLTANMGKSDLKDASSATEEGEFTDLGARGPSETGGTGETANP